MAEASSRDRHRGLHAGVIDTGVRDGGHFEVGKRLASDGAKGLRKVG